MPSQDSTEWKLRYFDSKLGSNMQYCNINGSFLSWSVNVVYLWFFHFVHQIYALAWMWQGFGSVFSIRADRACPQKSGAQTEFPLTDPLSPCRNQKQIPTLPQCTVSGSHGYLQWPSVRSPGWCPQPGPLPLPSHSPHSGVVMLH